MPQGRTPLDRRGLWLAALSLSRHGLNYALLPVYRTAMSEKKLGGSDAARAERLAEQLRANLRKRKAQARGGVTDAVAGKPTLKN